jgi:hypothetical protein
MRALFLDEAEGFVTGKDTILAFPSMPRTELVITAAELGRRFRENEVAADLALKDKQVLITGNVTSVRMDAVTRRPVTQLNSGSILAVQARMAGGTEESVAKYRTGQQVRLLCTGGGKELVSISLRECRDFEAVREPFVANANAEFEAWTRDGTTPSFRDREDDGKGWREFFFGLYLVARLQPPNWPCFRAVNSAPCQNAFRRTAVRKPTAAEWAEIKEIYSENFERLGLPPPLTSP